MHVVFNYDLHAEPGVISRGQAQQGQQHAVERPADEFDNDVMRKRRGYDNRRDKPKTEQYERNA
jgi:hypothetical protein